MATTFDRGVHLGGDDYNHATDSEFKRLRSQADQLYQKRQQLSQQSQLAYKSGDKQRAHELSEQAKKVLADAENTNRQAAEYVFRENNADSAGDEIDLHGLYVKEAEYILQNRLAAAISSNQSHLNVIVGKGLHSQGGIAKLKPAIDQMCDEAGLRHRIDSKNTGVLIIDLQGAQLSQIPNKWTISGGNQQQYQQQQQPHYQQQQPYNNHQQQQYNNNNNNNNNNDNSGLVGILVKILCSCINSK